MKQYIFKIVSVLLLTLCASVAYPCSYEETPVDMRGHWMDKGKANGGADRSLPPIPVTAYTDGSAVYLYNTAPDGDIVVSVADEYGTVLINRTVTEAESAYIVLSLASLDAGTYVLRIDGGDTGYLEF